MRLAPPLVTLIAGLFALAACGTKTPAGAGGSTTASGGSSASSSSGAGGASSSSSSSGGGAGGAAGSTSSSSTSSSSTSSSGTSSSSTSSSGAPICSGTLVACGATCVDLTSDVHDCGACGHDCLGATCTAGACAPTSVLSQTGVQQIAVDATSLFFTQGTGVYAVPLAGGTPAMISAAGPAPLAGADSLVLDRSNVFFMVGSPSGPAFGEVIEVGKTGSGQVVLAGNVQNYLRPSGLTVQLDATGAAKDLVWTSTGDGQSSSHPEIVKSGVGGSAGSQVLGVLPSLFATSIAIDATNAYVSSPDAGAVYAVPLAGGTPAVFASGLSSPMQVATDGQSLYVLDTGTGTGGNLPNGRILSIPLAGGPPVALASNLPNLGQMVVGGGIVYVTSRFKTANTADGSVLAVPVAGGPPVVIASGQPQPNAIALDAAYVYWADGAAPGSNLTGVWKAPR